MFVKINQTSIALIEKTKPKNKSLIKVLFFICSSRINRRYMYRYTMQWKCSTLRTICRVRLIAKCMIWYHSSCVIRQDYAYQSKREFNSYNGSKIVQSVLYCLVGFNYLLVKDYQALAILICPSKMDVEGLFLPAIDFSQMIQCFCWKLAISE